MSTKITLPKHSVQTLDNGMTIVLVPLKQTQLVTMGFFIKAGARDETDENQGVAHFLEHMMFGGTENRTSDQLFYELDTLGSSYNAATTYESTYYYVYGHSVDTKKLLDIMLDIYMNPKFNGRHITREKKVIMEELRTRADSPFSKLHTAISARYFSETSLARPIIGIEETIMGFKKKDFIKFREKNYTPNNTVFVITGNFQPAIIFSMLRRHLQKIEKDDIQEHGYVDEGKVIIKNMELQEEPYVKIIKNDRYQQAYAMITFPLFDMYNKNSKEIDIISSLLSSGFSSRLSDALRTKKGMTYNSSSYPLVYTDCGIFVVQIVINPTQLIDGLKVVMRELRKLKQKEIEKEELKKVVNTTRNDILFSLQKPLSLLTYYGINLMMDKKYVPNLDKELNSLKRVTRKSIQKIAQEIFITDKINLFLYGNIQDTDFSFLKV